MPSRNDITGDTLVSKKSSVAYRDNWDRIFNKEPAQEEDLSTNVEITDSVLKEMDRIILSSVYKECFLENHAEEVRRVFDTLYPETKLSDEQIKLIVLLWEEQVKDKEHED